MELRHLRYFVAAAEERHITRAATRLGLQQPPLSQQLRALEAEVGTALFHRVPRGVVLTEAGEAFLPEARAAIAAAVRATEEARHAAQGRTGRLQIGFVTSAALHPATPELIRSFTQAYPGVRLGVTEDNAARLTDCLARGALDVVLLRVPVVSPPGIVAEVLLREPALLALPAGHELLGGWIPGTDGPALPLRALAAERFILVRRDGAPGLYENLLVACRRAGFEPVVTAQVDRMITNLNLVAAGVGISVVPASMRSIHAGQVAYCTILDRPGFDAPLTMLFPSAPSAVASRFLALARQRMAEDALKAGSQ